MEADDASRSAAGHESGVVGVLAEWMPRQRWYATKGRTPQLRLVGAWDLAGGVRTLLVADDAAHPTVVYQVPLVEQAATEADHARDDFVGHPSPGRTLLDGTRSAAFTTGLLSLLTRGGSAEGDGAAAHGEPSSSAQTDSDALEGASAAVLSGEQSNTSIVYRPDGGSAAGPVICKVYRQLQAGTNPDIELQTALSQAGSPYVPRSVGSLSGMWRDPADPQHTLTGSLAFAQEFLPDVEDAWRVALRAATAQQPFTEPARDLGIATARVHVSLAEIFGAHPATTAERAAIGSAWRRRLGIAAHEVPAIAPLRDAIESVYLAADGARWPGLQRVHGDYHLGQVILVPGRGWVLLDFEGEPLRPMVERLRPDLAPRDVAGMLRSFDYVAGSIDADPQAADAWARDARDAFLAGYAAASETDLAALAPVLAALELDKAVYEAIYETRNRPSWASIPLAAVTRLVGD